MWFERNFVLTTPGAYFMPLELGKFLSMIQFTIKEVKIYSSHLSPASDGLTRLFIRPVRKVKNAHLLF